MRAEDRHGWSILHFAVRYGTEVMLTFLLAHGADLHQTEKRGWNLLHIAARNGMADKARLLLEHGINVHTIQNQGWNALHLAVRYGQPDTISTLLEYGINIDAHNKGWTALQLAALNGHTDIVSILLNKGADSSVTNRDGQTALDIARTEGHDRIVAFILETEFQAGDPPPLPSPPPTPPSAPPASELFGELSGGGDGSTFDRWKVQLQHDLEDASNDDITSDSDEGNSNGNNNDNNNSDDMKIRWKSFEEEKKELLQQLERVRLKEVNRIQEEMRRKQTRFEAFTAKVDRQAQVIQAQIAGLSAGIPSTQEAGRLRYSGLKEDISQISVLMENGRAEAALITALQSHQIQNSHAGVTGAHKRDLVRQLADAQLAEQDELAALQRQKYAEMENFEAWAASQVEKVERRVRILEAELRLLAEDRERKERLHKEGVARLEEELQRAERQRVVAQGEEDDDRLACPVCLELLRPPLRVFQCPEGHILCENCKVSYICNVHFKKYFSKAFKVSCIKGIVSQDFLGQQMMLMDTA